MIALDTHVAVWWTQTPRLLSTAATEAIRGADRILIPAIVFWEVALLVRNEWLKLNGGQPVGAWTQQVLAIPRVQEITLTARIALAADAADMHPDPADRFHRHHRTPVGRTSGNQGSPATRPSLAGDDLVSDCRSRPTRSTTSSSSRIVTDFFFGE